MQQLYMITYHLREDLGEDDLRRLTKQFAEVGSAPGVLAHYVRLDGTGGFILQERQENPEAGYENMLRYQPWIRAEATAVTTVEDAFPVIQRVYG